MARLIPLDTRDPGLPLALGERSIILNYNQMDLLQNLFYTEPSVRAAFRTKIRHMFGGSMDFIKKGFRTTRAMKHLLDTVWITCGRHALQSLFQFGFVIIGIHDETCPFVVNALEVEIEMIIAKDWKRTVRLQSRYDPFPLKVLKGYYYFEVDPPCLMTGQVRSMLVSTMQTSSFMNLMLQCAAKAERRKCMPPLITETTDQKAEEKELKRDYYAPGDDLAMHGQQDNVQQRQRLQMSAEMEAAVRAQNGDSGGVAGAGDGNWTHDPVTGMPRYPVDPSGAPYFNTRVLLEPHRKLVNNQQPTSPEFLVELLSICEADVGKITGVPPGLWGSQRSPIAVDMTIMNIFFAAQHEERMVLVSIFRVLFDLIYGQGNLWHTAAHYDAGKTPEENWKDAEVEISLPGLMDPEVLMMLQDRGSLEWEAWRECVSKYFGIPIQWLPKEYIPPPHVQDEVTVQDATMKAQETRKRNAKAVGSKYSKKPNSDTPGVKRQKTKK